MDPYAAISEACEQVTVKDIHGYIAHSCSMYNDFYLN